MIDMTMLAVADERRKAVAWIVSLCLVAILFVLAAEMWIRWQAVPRLEKLPSSGDPIPVAPLVAPRISK